MTNITFKVKTNKNTLSQIMTKLRPQGYIALFSHTSISYIWDIDILNTEDLNSDIFY